MRLRILYEEKDIAAIKQVVSEQSQRTLIVQRERRNVKGNPPEIDEDVVWGTHLMCLLTTQQPSGPTGAVYRFLSQNPFPLSLESCQRGDTEELVRSCLSSFGGIRFTTKIPKQAAYNLSRLQAAGWQDLMEFALRLRKQRLQDPIPAHEKLERDAALYLDHNLQGFGPKQSRNFWQALGLTRYQFVLDSRILRWLHRLDLPFPLASEGLGNEKYYSWVSDILRELCAKADVLPCVFGAAVFASYDAEEWPEGMSIF